MAPVGIGIDIGDIAELDTRIGMTGALATGMGGDELFEMVVSIVLLVYETSPP